MIEPVRVIAIRHGRTAWNAGGRLQGQLDIGLDDLGRWQALRLVPALQGEPVAAVYSSDLSRALETARPLAQAHGLAVVTDPGLRERSFGDMEGLSHAEIESQRPADALAWCMRSLDHAPPGGETLPQFEQRCLGCAIRLLERHRGQLVVLVTHGGVLDCLYRAAVGLALDVPRNWPLNNAAVNRLLLGSEGFSLLGWDDHQHLETDAHEDPAVPAAADDASVAR